MHFLPDARLLPSSDRHIQTLRGRGAIQTHGAGFEEFGEFERPLDVFRVDRTCVEN